MVQGPEHSTRLGLRPTPHQPLLPCLTSEGHHFHQEPRKPAGTGWSLCVQVFASGLLNAALKCK